MGTTYNLILVRCKFGYPMRDHPTIILVSRFFYHNKDGHLDMKDRIVRAWNNIHRKSKDWLEKKQCVALKPYTDWVQAIARKVKIPYLLEEPSLPVALPLSSIIPTKNREEYQELIAKMKLKRDTWEKNFQTS